MSYVNPVNYSNVEDIDFKAVLKENRLVVVDFWAEWCGPCKMYAPVFQEVSEDMAGTDVAFVKADVDKHHALAAEYNVRSIPHTLIFKNGKVIDAIIGAVRTDELSSRISKHI